MPTRKVAVIAIGGNSLILSKDAQTVQDQYRALCVTGKHIVSLVELGYQVVVTYGNGPQVASCCGGAKSRTPRPGCTACRW